MKKLLCALPLVLSLSILVACGSTASTQAPSDSTSTSNTNSNNDSSPQAVASVEAQEPEKEPDPVPEWIDKVAGTYTPSALAGNLESMPDINVNTDGTIIVGSKTYHIKSFSENRQSSYTNYFILTEDENTNPMDFSFGYYEDGYVVYTNNSGYLRKDLLQDKLAETLATFAGDYISPQTKEIAFTITPDLKYIEGDASYDIGYAYNPRNSDELSNGFIFKVLDYNGENLSLSAFASRGVFSINYCYNMNHLTFFDVTPENFWDFFSLSDYDMGAICYNAFNEVYSFYINRYIYLNTDISDLYIDDLSTIAVEYYYKCYYSDKTHIYGNFKDDTFAIENLKHDYYHSDEDAIEDRLREVIHDGFALTGQYYLLGDNIYIYGDNFTQSEDGQFEYKGIVFYDDFENLQIKRCQTRIYLVKPEYVIE